MPIRIMREIATPPPTAAPTMTLPSMFELLFGKGEEAPEAGFTVEEDSPKSDDALLVLDTGMVAVEWPSIAPGAGSGKSTKKDVCVRH
jgi:hypothetical protein